MSALQQAVNTLGENFSEIESDISSDVYKVLGPHIYEIAKEVGTLNKEADRLVNVSRLVQLLLSTDRIKVDKDIVDELEESLETGGEFNTYLVRIAITESETVRPLVTSIRFSVSQAVKHRLIAEHNMTFTEWTSLFPGGVSEEPTVRFDDALTLLRSHRDSMRAAPPVRPRRESISLLDALQHTPPTSEDEF